MNPPKLRIPLKNITFSPTPMTSLLDGFTFDDIEYLIDTNPYLRGYLQGYLAELALQRKLEKIPGVTSVKKIPDAEKRKGDLEVTYNGKVFTIECKSLETASVKHDCLHETWVGSVGIKNTDKRTVTIEDQEVSLTNLTKGTFDILAISCFAVNGHWDFVFIENKYLPEHDEYEGFIPTRIPIDPTSTPCLTDNIIELFEKQFDRNAIPAC